MLHNVGKLSKAFLDREIDQTNKVSADTELRKYQYERVAGRIRAMGRDYDHALKSELDVSFERFDGPGLLDALLREFEPLEAPFHDRTYTPADIIEFQDNGRAWGKEGLAKVLGEGATSALTWLMYQAHNQASGGEKRSEEREGIESKTEKEHRIYDPDLKQFAQKNLPWWGSSVFGIERTVPETYRAQLLELKQSVDAWMAAPAAQERFGWIAEIEQLLGSGVADSRRPVNDVWVSDIGMAGAAFFKAAMAGSLLSGTCDKLQWRFLHVAVDVAGFYEQSERIPDMLERRQAVLDGLDAVRRELEVETPLGNEIFRWSGGSIFLVAHFDEATQNECERLIQRAWAGEAHLLEELSCEVRFGPGFALGAYSPQSSFHLGKILREELAGLGGRADLLAAKWQGKQKAVCPVCGVRPVADEKRAGCRECEQRRAGRARSWLAGHDKTIWVDEVADGNGRLALVAVRFRLEPWLDKGGYISSSLRVGKSKETGAWLSKTESFARMRRVWRTTEAFLAAAGREIESKPEWMRGGRVLIEGTVDSGRVGVGRTYSLELTNERQVSVVCAGPQRLVLTENVDRVQRVWLVEDLVRELEGLEGGTLRVLDPEFAGGSRQVAARFTVGRVTFDKTWAYAPVIPLVSEPGLMMVMVPADRALDVVQGLHARYEAEMGKVRNRLAMDVGVVFGESAIPVRALLDAGRRLVSHRPAKQTWVVEAVGNGDGGRWLRLGVTEVPEQPVNAAWKGGCSQEWLPHTERAVSTRQAGKTEKAVRTEQTEKAVRTEQEVDRSQQVRTQTQVVEWVVPVDDWYSWFARDLQVGDRVPVEPSVFDYEYLDTAGRRFEIAYGEGTARRRGRSGSDRPYPMEEISELKRAWELLRDGLQTSQIKGMDALLAAKRDDWGDEAWAAEGGLFAWQVLSNLEWAGGHRPDDDQMHFLAGLARRGALADVIELFLRIPKTRIGKKGVVSE